MLCRCCVTPAGHQAHGDRLALNAIALICKLLEQPACRGNTAVVKLIVWPLLLPLQQILGLSRSGCCIASLYTGGSRRSSLSTEGLCTRGTYEQHCGAAGKAWAALWGVSGMALQGCALRRCLVCGSWTARMKGLNVEVVCPIMVAV